MEFPEPQAEHKWLDQLLGEWTMEGECNMGPDQPPMKNTGTDTVRSLGGLWVVCEGEGGIPGTEKTSRSLLTLGYDPAKQRFVGTFIASCMNHLWVYEGTLDESRKVLTLDTLGPSFSKPGELAKYQDIFTIISPDHRTLASRCQGDDGNWIPFMLAHYRRTA